MNISDVDRRLYTITQPQDEEIIHCPVFSVEISGLLILYKVRQTHHLIFDVYVVIQVSQASLLES